MSEDLCFCLNNPVFAFICIGAANTRAVPNDSLRGCAHPINPSLLREKVFRH